MSKKKKGKKKLENPLCVGPFIAVYRKALRTLALGENRNPPAPHLRSPPQPARRWLRAGVGLPAGTHSWDLGPTCRARQEPALPSSRQAASPAGAFGVPGDGVQGRGRKLLPTQADSAWKCPGEGCSPRGVPSSLWSCSGHPQKELSPRQDSVSEVMAGWKTGRPLDSRRAKGGPGVQRTCRH